jgi:hypothetical protein
MVLSRRRFLNYTLLCSYTPLVQAATRKRLVATSPPRDRVLPALQLFTYSAVQLGAGRMREQFQYQSQLFLDMDNDRLLKPFRLRAGLPAPGADMGGWYDSSNDFHIDPADWSTANWHGYIPGHSFGQYVSGLARSFAATGDQRTARKVAKLISLYSATISPRFFVRYPLPAYTYDKLAIGLIDAYHLVGVQGAKAVLDKLTDVVLPFLPEKALTRDERRQRPYAQEAEIWDEPYTLPENLFLAWKLGMGERYKELALRYMQDEALFDPLARGKSPFAGLHAYSHVNALNSAIQAYLVTGEAKYLAAARNGFDFLERQSYATGGWGPNEELIGPDDTETLRASLQTTHRSFETPCGAYGHFKLTRHLLQITKLARYGDSMERVLYNTILGAKPTMPDGRTFYYADYHQQAHKVYRGEAWPCCSGTYIQLAADYGISAYLNDADTVYVNLYIPSRLAVKAGGADWRIEQRTGYPMTNTSVITVESVQAVRHTLALRIPSWAGAKTSVSINDDVYRGPVIAGEFLKLTRTWHSGDRVTIAFDMGVRLEALNAAHPELVAVVTGPLALFAIGTGDKQFTRQQLLAASRESASEWVVAHKDGPVRLKPFMAIDDETYRLYQQLART